MIVGARFTNTARQSTAGDKKKSGKLPKKNSTSCQTFISVKSKNDRPMSHSSCNEQNSNQFSVSAFQTIHYGSLTNLHYIGINKWGLICQQSFALKVTWRKLCKIPHSACRNINSIMEEVFNRLNEKNKTLRDIFYNAAFVNGMAERRTIATLHDHSHFFISLISQIIKSLDVESDDIFKHINKIGLCHFHLTKYGFQQKLWEKLGEELIDVLVVQNCVRSFPGSCRAWTILISNLIDHLSAATRNSYSVCDGTKSQYRSKLTSPAIYLKSISNSQQN
ncbi:unnamed protein product [Cercopithifilaria johnstoni]|uniref:Globin family profile domain-containing protein n=1 Tax=Cercopithifilaria johnstoni TaxID=2874296 RepID=A0A8J2LQS1_9BILA|nr:unnamed protein product [Cercopithifilaria johnstoni]